MITEKELVELQLNSIFGHMMPVMVKNIINRELDESIWEDGYETAVTEKDLNCEEGKKLLDILLKSNPYAKIDLDKLESIIDTVLPQSVFEKVNWIVSDDSSFIMTDSLRVAKFQKSKVIWCTPRISLDGISLKEIRNGKIYCFTWQGSSAYKPDEPFILDYQNGEVLSGNLTNW